MIVKYEHHTSSLLGFYLFLSENNNKVNVQITNAQNGLSNVPTNRRLVSTY